VSDRHSYYGSHTRVWARPAVYGFAGHQIQHQTAGSVVRTPGAQSRYLLQCGVFLKTLTQLLQFGKKNGLSRWPPLGKNFRRILRKCSFARIEGSTRRQRPPGLCRHLLRAGAPRRSRVCRVGRRVPGVGGPHSGPHSVRTALVGPISDPAALSIVWKAALGVLVPSTSMRPFISLSCSREHDRLRAALPFCVLFPGR
jgi:hypothetical protein